MLYLKCKLMLCSLSMYIHGWFSCQNCISLRYFRSESVDRRKFLQLNNHYFFCWMERKIRKVSFPNIMWNAYYYQFPFVFVQGISWGNGSLVVNCIWNNILSKYKRVVDLVTMNHGRPIPTRVYVKLSQTILGLISHSKEQKRHSSWATHF